MEIRESTSKDVEDIRAVHLGAFGEQEGPSVSQLAIDLLEDSTNKPVLSLVAGENNAITGNIIFSPVTIENHENVAACILAPLAVARHYQGNGIGSALVTWGLKLLEEREMAIAMVLGDPGYYTRFGFRSDHNLKPPYELDYPEAWMAIEIRPGCLGSLTGNIKCAAPLQPPEHW